MRAPHRGDEGFTLIETVIAMLIMAIAVVAIVGALTTLISLTGGHRGQAVVETSSRSFAQALQAQAQATTVLSSGVNANVTTLQVQSAALVPPAGGDTFVRVGREVMQVTAVNRGTNRLTVVRAASGSGTNVTHASGAAVIPFTRCPEPSAVEPSSSGYLTTAGVVHSVASVDYWQPSGAGAGAFVDRSTCLAAFAARCPTSVVLPECSTGLVRARISVKTDGDTRLDQAETMTTVLVRRGSV